MVFGFDCELSRDLLRSGADEPARELVAVVVVVRSALRSSLLRRPELTIVRFWIV